MIGLRTTVTILRCEESGQGTFGVLLIDGQVFCVTLEPCDNENQRDVSSIPAQQYTCKRQTVTSYGPAFLVQEVPGRHGILFHYGNWAENTAGCILLGKSWGVIGGRRCIISSRPVFKDFMTIMKDVKEFNLTIREIY